MELSIITPVYNGEKTIRRTIESIVKQNYTDYEYIIVDGDSTDGTLKIVEEYKKILKDRLIVISEKDDGIYDAMNKGINISKGRIIGIINSDDWYEDKLFGKIVAEMSDMKCNIVYGFMRTIKDSREYQISLNNSSFLNERMINHPSCFVTKTVYEKYGLYNTKYKIAADYDFMIRVYLSNPDIFCPIYFLIANFSLGGASQSYEGWMEQLQIKKKYGFISQNKYRYEALKNIIKKILKVI